MPRANSCAADTEWRSSASLVEAALAELRGGRMVLVVDDEDRENEGDLIMAAELATPETMAFMISHTSELLCVGITDERAEQLRLPLMVADSDDPRGTAFTVSIDLKARTTTGAAGRVPSEYGEFTAVTYRSLADDCEHVALVMGEVSQSGGPDGTDPVLVRVHSECLTGDVFASRRCDCGEQLALAMRKIGEAGRGVVVYLRGYEGRGIGLSHKLRAYNLQDAGMDTVDANLAQGLPVDSREYGIGAQMLRDLGVRETRMDHQLGAGSPAAAPPVAPVPAVEEVS